MSEIEEFKMISLKHKVKEELKQFLDIENDTLTEYVISQCLTCQDEDEFFIKMNQQDQSFVYELAVNIHFLVNTFYPQENFFQKPKEKIIKVDDQYNDKNEEIDFNKIKENFPGLAMQDTQIKQSQQDIIPKKNKENKDIFLNNFKTLKQGRIYKARILKVLDFGLMIEIKLKKKYKIGLVHISQIKNKRIENIYSEFDNNQKIFCEFIEKNSKGKYSFSMKKVNQYTGEYQTKKLSKFNKESNEKLQQQYIKFIQNQEYGPLTGIKLDLNSKTGRTYEVDQVDLWERKQMEYMLGKSNIFQNKEEDLNSVDFNEEDIQIEVKDIQPNFLKGQKKESQNKNFQINLFRKKLGHFQSQISSTQDEQKKRRLEKIKFENENIVNEMLIKSKAKIIPPQKQSKSKNKFIRQTNLPIFDYKTDLLKVFEDNQIIIVVGETGSGKTTQMPQFFLEYYKQKSKHNLKKIGCTQPRRIAARSVATRVSQEMQVQLGQEVGYSIRFEDRTSPKTLIKYMTDGMLLRECLIDKLLSQYQVIIIDEVHERKIQTDIIMCLLKKVCAKRKDFKLVITSATLNSNKFSTYFNDCPVFKIPGRAFPVKIFFTQKPEVEYLQAAVQCALNIHLSEDKGDILLFLTGQEEIETACGMLQQKVKKIEDEIGPLLIYPVYAALPQEKQQLIFEQTPEGSRKIVIATNIAEASLTIDGIYYVIDPGFAKVKFYNSKLGLEQLTIVPISQASADQRAGRAGRTGPGKCYRLYTEKCYEEEMYPNSIPEIQRLNLSHILLILKALGINNLIEFDFIDKPYINALVNALEDLYHLGALNENGIITQLGLRMSDFPLDPQLAKLLLASVDLMCSQEVVTIIGMLSVQGVFYRPKNLQSQVDQQLKKFQHIEGDHLMLLNVFKAWIKNERSDIWCHDNFIKPKSMLKALDIRNQLYEMLLRQQLPVFSCQDDDSRIRKSILAGFFKNVARKNQKVFQVLIDDQVVYIHPSSCLFNKRLDYVVFHELIMTSKEYMRQITRIEPKWLIQVAPNFYQLENPEKLNSKKLNFKVNPLLNNKNKPNNEWRMNRRIKDLNQLLNQIQSLTFIFLYSKVLQFDLFYLKIINHQDLLYAYYFYYEIIRHNFH